MSDYKAEREQYLADIKAKRWCKYVPERERPVLSTIINLAIDKGYLLSVFDSEEYVVKRSNDAALVRSQLGHTGEDTLIVRDSEGEALGTFSFIYDNGSEGDPMVVICDYGWYEGTEEKIEELYKAAYVKYG